MTYAELEGLVTALNALAVQRMNIAASEKILTLMTRLGPSFEIYLKLRNALVTEHAGEGGTISPQHPNWQEFAEPFGNLRALEVPVELNGSRLVLADLWRRGTADDGAEKGARIPLDVSALELQQLAPVLAATEPVQ